MKRPKEKDYFQFRGKNLILSEGACENYMEMQDEYIDHLEKRNNELLDLLDKVTDYVSFPKIPEELEKEIEESIQKAEDK